MDPRLLQVSMLLHIVGFILWVGTLLAVSWLMLYRQSQEAAVRPSFAMAARRLAVVADVGATLALIGGLVMLIGQRATLLKQGYMHIKLTLVVVMIVLHAVVRIKTKRGTQTDAVFPPALFMGVGLVGVAIVYTMIFTPMAK